MIYEGIKVVGLGKPFEKYQKKYIICVRSTNFWVVYDETNVYKYARSIVSRLELDGDECIIIKNKC